MDVAFTVDKYEILDLLGSGTFGSVYKGKNKTTGQVVALKQIKRLHSEDGFPLSTIREIKILRELNHKNIMKLIEIISDKASKTINRLAEDIDNTIINNTNTLPIVINNFNKTMIEIGEAANSLKNLADFLERHPESLLKGKVK